MNDQFDNKEDPDFGDDFGFGDEREEHETAKQKVQRLWQESTPFKLGVIGGAVGLIIVVISLFSGGEELAGSRVTPGSAVKGAPGGEKSTEVYEKALDESETDRETLARMQGSSFMPIPRQPPKRKLDLGEGEKEQDDDPLGRWRAQQRERLHQLIENRKVEQLEDRQNDEQQRQQLAALMEAKRKKADALAQAMRAQMASILASINLKQASKRRLSSQDYVDGPFGPLNSLKAAEEEMGPGVVYTGGVSGSNVSGGLVSVDNVGLEEPEVLIAPGTIVYGQMLLEANSDIPGPIMGQILSGPLKGSRIIGSFSMAEDEYLILTFRSAVVNDELVQINTMVVDPKTTLQGLATDVDPRYLKRLVLPVAASFITGLADAIADVSRTTVTSLDGGGVVAQESRELDLKEEIASAISQAGEEVSDFVNEEASKTKPLVRVEAGTPFGLVFLGPVMKPEGFDEE